MKPREWIRLDDRLYRLALSAARQRPAREVVAMRATLCRLIAARTLFRPGIAALRQSAERREGSA